ncbi:MAG: energy transducer TonB [Pyrinomonadaceae bacterium]
MKLIPIFLTASCLFSGLSLANGQEQSEDKTKEIPYIEVVDCYKCNDLVISLPNPKYPALVGTGPHIYNGRVGIQILIDENGKVETAIGIFGNPFFRPILEKEAKKAIFKPKIIDGKPTETSSVIIYQIVSRITQEASTTKKVKLPPVCSDCLLPDNAILLPEPKYPAAARAVGVFGTVTVEIVVNKLGKVVYAKAVSGHPLLWAASEKAALRAKFKPALLSKRPVSVRTTIAYKYVL